MSREKFGITLMMGTFILVGLAAARPALAQEHIKSATVEDWNLPGHGAVRGVHMVVDGSKIWTATSTKPFWPSEVGGVALRPGYRIEVWGRRNHTKLLRTARGADALRPVTFKLEPQCNDYFVCVFGTRDGSDFVVPVVGDPTVAGPDQQKAYCSTLFDATNAGDGQEYHIRVHFTTNVGPLEHYGPNDD